VGRNQEELTGFAKPGLVLHRFFRGQEIHPLGCVYMLVQLVLYKYGLYSLPINFRWFHITKIRHREREREREREFSGGGRDSRGNVTVGEPEVVYVNVGFHSYF